MGTCEPLGQHRIRRWRQGLQAQARDHGFRDQKRHRIRFQERRSQEFFHVKVQERCDHKVFYRNQVFRNIFRYEVFHLFGQQGTQNRYCRQVLLRSRLRHHQDCITQLQPFLLFFSFHYLQQAFNHHLQQAVDFLILLKVRKFFVQR